MGIFNFFKKKEALPAFDLSKIGVDIHSHLIPGIDDGAQTMDDSIAMLAKFQDMGFTKVITTPHIMTDAFPNTSETILGGLEKVREEIEKVGLTIQIEAAAEYYFDETLMKKIKNNDLLTFGGNHVLVEFGFHNKPQYADEMFFELLTHGYKPVVAHFERYLYYLGSLDQAIKWRSKGVNIQLNLNSLTGHYGPEIQKQAEKMIDEVCFDYVGTDCHRIEHLMLLEENLHLPHIHKLGQYLLKNKML